MNIQITISDNLYARLVNGTCRVQGTLGLVNPSEGNFNEHHKSKGRKGDKFIKLPHGKASVGEDVVKLSLVLDRKEAGLVASEAILCESRWASEFVVTEMEEDPS